MKPLIRSILLCTILVFVFILSGCEMNPNRGASPDEVLLSYLPNMNESYTGDSGYYHVVKSIENETSDTEVVSILKGEVRDNSIEKSNKDFGFEIRLVVDSEAIVQTTIGTELNESIFSRIVLLKRPIEVGNSWNFTTTNNVGKKVKVTGKIVSIESDGEIVVVNYSTKDGYSEERTVKKGRGTTDFTRMVIYKNESSITGYHSEQNSAISSGPPESTSPTNEAIKEEISLNEVKIPVATYNLILNFENSWAEYVKQENDNLLEYILVDSPAFDKINAVTRDAATAIEFVTFYPYEVRTEAPYTIIKVVEKFVTLQNEEVENKVQYTMVVDNNVFKIVDFELVE